MSTAVIIKNTILVILIILIGHFMVKNILLERPQEVTIKSESNVSSMAKVLTPKVESKTLEVLNEKNIVVEKPSGILSSTVTGNIQGGLDKAKEELLKFINDDEDDIERYFGNDKSLPFTPSDNCKGKEQEAALRLSTTCDPALQDLKDDKVRKTMTTNECIRDSKNVMILKEYENESIMNGGALFGGLSAYDVFDNNFQLYSS